LSLANLPLAGKTRLEPAHQIAQYAFKSGHASFQLNQGRAARIFLGDQCVGFCFEGDGSVSYLSSASWEAASLRYNLSKNSSIEPIPSSDGLVVSGRFKRAIFWMGGSPFAPFTGPDAPALEETYKDLGAQFAATGSTEPGTELVAQAENHPALPWVRAQLAGSGDPLMYEFDPGHSRFETLSVLKKPNFRDPLINDTLDNITISKQPIGWDLHKPVLGEYMLTAVDVDLKQTGKESGELTVQETIRPFAPLKLARFNFDSQVFGNNGRGLVLHRARITQVLDGQGHPLPFQQDLYEVSVELPQPAARGVPVQLTFKAEGDFLISPTNGNYWQLGTSAWFPQPDLNGQDYTWHATVRTPKPWQAFSCGETVRRWQDGDLNAVETRSEKPIAFGVILGGDYQIERETRDGLTVEIATYGSKAQFSKALVDMAFHVIKYYEGFLGPYPYKEFHILEKNEWGYGQAPASIMFITKEAFNSTIDELNQEIAIDVRHRFVHEIAHQWWGTVVKMPSSEEQWLTESFADVCASLCLQDWPKGAAKGDYVRLLATWKSDAQFATDKATIPTANWIWTTNGDDLFRIRTGLVYDKGAWLLNSIRKEIGDDKFLLFLKSYQANFRWKFGTTKDVAGLLSFITKKDWNPWFEKNYWGTGLPDAKE
jgi:hypothetical protein